MNAIFNKFGAKVPEPGLLEEEVAWMLNINNISIEKIRATIYKHLVLQWEMGPDIEGHLAMLRLSLEMTDQVIASLPVTKGNQKRIIIYINRYSRYIGYKRLIEEYGLDADARRHFCERGARLFPGELAGKWR